MNYIWTFDLTINKSILNKIQSSKTSYLDHFRSYILCKKQVYKFNLSKK